MNPQYKFVIKVWSIALALSLATSYAINYTSSSELVLIIRLLGTAFFAGLYLHVCKVINKFEKLKKASNGFMEYLFDPNYLKITLMLCILGWTAYAFMEYLALPVDWVTVFILGVVIFPFASGKIPLYVKKEKWRR